MNQSAADAKWMQRALNLACQGLGRVEPNPLVGCVLVKDDQLVGEGWHEQFGGPHAEVNALHQAGPAAAGATAYVTLEPCSHVGKTPPCADALIKAGITRVVVAHPDPNPLVAGAGLARLRQAAIQVETGSLQDEARFILAPYLKRITTGLPWIIAKWAMTWDGKIATASGDSQWISNELSRQIVHQIRGRVDGIMVGANTVQQDDPRLTARPAGYRLATRIVLDSLARIGLDSQICRTAREIPTLIAVSHKADADKLAALRNVGCEIWQSGQNDADQSTASSERLGELLQELARRGMTNLLVEGGGELLGSLFDLQQIDEVHVFIGGKIFGGREALTPVGGLGAQSVLQGQSLELQSVRQLENDVYLIGRTKSNRS